MTQRLSFLLMFYGIFAFAQKSPIFIKGNIQVDSINIEDVHIVNKTTKIGTTSNEFGNFEIPVQIGDILHFSHLNYEFNIVYITEKKSVTTLEIIGSKKTHLLEAFTLNNKSVFYVDKEIMPHNLPVVNATTLKLPYANSKKIKRNALISIQSGASINLENLIARINGNHKRIQKAKKLFSEDQQLTEIRKLFTDDFFITDLKIKKEYINQFLNFCKSKPILAVFKKNNVLELIRILEAESSIFPHQIENENIFLTLH